MSLDLASNSGSFKNILGARGAEAMKGFLVHQGKDCLLNFLNIKQCSLGNEGVTILCRGLRVNRSLLTLNLSGNGLTPKSIDALVKSLPATLVELDLSDNDIRDEGVSTLCYYLYYRHEEHSDDEEDDFHALSKQ